MGLFWVVFGVGISVWSATFPFGGLANPGPGYLPLACGVLIALLGAGLIFMPTTVNEERAGSDQHIFPRGLACRRVVLTVASMLFCAGMMNVIGFILAVFVALIFLMRVVGTVRWKMAFFYALLYTVGSYILFEVFLKTPFPVGTLWL